VGWCTPRAERRAGPPRRRRELARVAQHLAVGRDRVRVALAGLRFGLGSRRPVTFALLVGDRRVPFTVPDWAAMAVVVEVRQHALRSTR
jgi:hypothetical protein